MNKSNYIYTTALLALCASINTSAIAGQATIPFTFVSGDPALATEVNDNFTSLKTAIDDNDSRITPLESNDATQQASVDDHETRITNIETGAISIPPSAFVNNGTGDCRYRTTTSKNYGAIDAGAPGFCGLAAPLYLPHGRTMTSLTCYLVDNDGTNDFDITLTQHNMTDPLATANSVGLFYLTTNAQQDPAVTAKTDSTINAAANDAIIDNNTYQYQLRVSVDSGFTGGDALSMYGCKVNYQ